jgi:sugar phosphate isomerase/epimerase
MTPAPERTFAEVGHGTLDIPGIIAAADAAGAEWLIVEQDRCARPPLESIKMSREYLRSLGR